MKASRFVKAFEKDVDHWERCLSLILEVIEMVLTVQRQWMYLEVRTHRAWALPTLCQLLCVWEPRNRSGGSVLPPPSETRPSDSCLCLSHSHPGKPPFLQISIFLLGSVLNSRSQRGFWSLGLLPGFLIVQLVYAVVWERGAECGGCVRNSLSSHCGVPQNIFIGEDIRKQLPNESALFDQVNNNWKAIMDRMSKDSNALRSTHYPGESSMGKGSDSCPWVCALVRSRPHASSLKTIPSSLSLAAMFTPLLL